MSSPQETSKPLYRQLSNGTRIFPRRGKPPLPEEGYEVDRGDPYIHLPKMPKCKYRVTKQPDSDCCGQSPRLYCEYFEKLIVRSTCVKCSLAS